MTTIHNKTVFKFTNFFPEEIHQHIYHELSNSLQWGMIQNSNANKQYPEKIPICMKHSNKNKPEYNPSFWINILGGSIPMDKTLNIHNPYYEETIFNKIKQKIKVSNTHEFKPYHIYANGQTVGQTGNWHQDSTKDTDWTFLYYVNTEWDVPKWAGSTYFADCENYNETPYVKFYQPNTAILFKSSIWHYADPPSLQSNVLRMTLTYKMRLHEIQSTQ